MKIEVGKYYRTRAGKKAFIGYEKIGEYRTFNYPMCGHIEENVDGPNDAHSWGKGGARTPDHKSSTDLISEWEDAEEIDISEWYHPAWELCNKNWFEGSNIIKTKDEALKAAKEGLRKGLKYGVVKHGTTKITDVRVK